MSRRFGKMPSMTEHARRILLHVLDALAEVEAGTADIPSLQASASGGAAALDNADRDLRVVLERLGDDLEMIRFTVDDAEQARAARQAAEPLLRVASEG